MERAIQPTAPRAAQLSRERFEPTTPFGVFGRMMDEMDRLFGGFGFGGRRDLGLTTRAAGEGFWSPAMEVREQDGKLVVRADLPGLKPDDVQVEVEDDVLTIRGERRSEHEEEQQGVYHCERTYGRFERSITLPRGVDPNAIEARFENGVLEISTAMPREQVRGRRIDVKGSTQAVPTTNEPKSVKH